MTPSKQQTVNRLCAKYLAGGTTRKDEIRLARMLLEAESEGILTAEWRDCLALLALSAARREKPGQRRHISKPHAIAKQLTGIAAAAAILIAVSSLIFRFAAVGGEHPGNVCLAIVGGEKIENRETVISMMDVAIFEAAQALTDFDNIIDSQFSDCSNLIENRNNSPI